MGDASKIVIHRCPEPIVNRLEWTSKDGVRGNISSDQNRNCLEGMKTQEDDFSVPSS